MKRYPLFFLTLFLPCASIFAAGGRGGAKMPDFTKGDPIPVGYTHDWNLGPTGARGWIYGNQLETKDARQIRITKVEPGSPADGVLRDGDVILGVGNQPFPSDARKLFGQAINEAEKEIRGGKLPILRWRDGKTEQVILPLPVMGSYSATAPWNCPKSAKILDQGLAALAKTMQSPNYRPNDISRSLNALALLASGDKEYRPLLEREAKWAAGYTNDGYKTWFYSYVMIFLSEYIMETGDVSPLPGLRRLALDAASGQSIVGSWGHKFADENGRLQGYGMMNSPGIPLTIGLVLAKKAGVNEEKVADAIRKSTDLLRFYVGKGSIPYGDHEPWIQNHDDNGKNGMAAVLFSLLGEASAAEYFSRMSIACHGMERDTGHTGNFFNIIWALPGIAPSGQHATGAWMKEFGGWYFDLARQANGSVLHQGPPEPRGDSYRGWDCTGAWLIAYAIPRGKLYITGKGNCPVPKINAAAAQSIINDGRGWTNTDRDSYYNGLSTDQLFEKLASWSPVVRERASIALGQRRDDIADRLIDLLKSRNLFARLGACQALKFQRARGATAVPELLNNFNANDLWLRIQSAQALAGIGEPAKVAVPEMLRRLAAPAQANDPRNMEQRYLSVALFQSGRGLIGRSLEGVDRELLFTAVLAGLQNQDGRSRSSIASIYSNLSFEELKPLLPAIHRAIVEPAPSGIMFADGIQTAGLELFAKHHVDEGIELLADYVRNMKQHGSQVRVVMVLKMLEGYGAHAQRVIPRLNETIDYFENRELNFPKNLSMDKARYVRESIARIQASTDLPKLTSLQL